MDNEKLLQQFGIRATAVRLLILKGVSDYAAPFSLEDMYNHLVTIDRSTVFRALALFEEQGLLHGFEDGSGKKKYCLNCGSHSGDAHAHHHHGHHIHATCRVCGRSFCIEAAEELHLPTPAGFEVENVNYIISGVCASCKR